jgi:hypothetical protein
LNYEKKTPTEVKRLLKATEANRKAFKASLAPAAKRAEHNRAMKARRLSDRSAGSILRKGE